MGNKLDFDRIIGLINDEPRKKIPYLGFKNDAISYFSTKR